MLYIGRIMGGAAGGIVSVVAPSYVGKNIYLARQHFPSNLVREIYFLHLLPFQVRSLSPAYEASLGSHFN